MFVLDRNDVKREYSCTISTSLRNVFQSKKIDRPCKIAAYKGGYRLKKLNEYNKYDTHSNNSHKARVPYNHKIQRFNIYINYGLELLFQKGKRGKWLLLVNEHRQYRI